MLQAQGTTQGVCGLGGRENAAAAAVHVFFWKTVP